MKNFATLLCLCSVTVNSYANDSEDFAALYGDTTMVAIATGTYKPVHLAPAVTSVISAEDLRRMGATTVAEALELIPGLHNAPSSVKDMLSIFSIRGIQTNWNNQVLFAINGVPQRDFFNSTRPATYRLPINNISRIEVVRGPSSALHGADAFAGVINVITKSVDELNGLQMGGRLGSFNSKDSWLQYGRNLGSWQLALSAEHTQSDGDPNRRWQTDAASGLGSSIANRYPLQTFYDIWFSRAQLSNPNWNIALSDWQQRKGGTGPGVAQAIDPNGWHKARMTELDINYRLSQQLAGWQISTRFTHQRNIDNNSFMILPPGSMVPIGDDGNVATQAHPSCPDVSAILGLASPFKACLTSFPDGLWGNPGGKGTINYFEINGQLHNSSNHQILGKIGWTQIQTASIWETKNFGPGTPAAQIGDGLATAATFPATNIPYWSLNGSLSNVSNTPAVFLADQNRRSWFVALQDEWQLARDWTFTGGARYDKYSDFGSTFNPRAALVWNSSLNLTSKLLFGSAFRAPSFTELAIKNNPVTIGNPTLEPERIHTLELAFDYHPNNRWRHYLNSYHYRAKDLIEYDANKLSQNLRKQNGYGIELESQWQPSPNVELMLSYAWQKSKDQSSGAATPNVPRQELSANLSWQAGQGWLLHSSLNHIRDRQRPQDGSLPRAATPHYTLLNIGVRKRLNDQFELSAYLRNALDEKALEPSLGSNLYLAQDYPMEGRNGFIELSYKMGKK